VELTSDFTDKPPKPAQAGVVSASQQFRSALETCGFGFEVRSNYKFE